MKTILCVGNDQTVIDTIQTSLPGYNIITATTRTDAIKHYNFSSPDLVIVDHTAVGLPPEDYVPGPGVIVVNSSSDPETIGFALDGGADDYMVKPVCGRELAVRVKALLRRTQPQSHSLIFGPIVIDTENYTVKVNGRTVSLTLLEYKILLLLVEKKDFVLTRDDILSTVWGFSLPSYERNVDVMIRRIRLKLGEEYRDMIKTVTGVGYRMSEPGVTGHNNCQSETGIDSK